MQKTNALLEKCLQDNFPIVRKATSDLILSLIDKHGFTSLLEIGTGYGYSCSLWIQNKNLDTIVSIEKITSNFLIAQSFVNDPRLTLINDNAFDYVPQQQFDLIFVDGPKSHQELLVKKYLHYLNSHGVMVIDNLYLKKIRNIPVNQLTKNQLKLISKVDKFNAWLQNDLVGYDFRVYDIDDGVGVITKSAK